MSDSLDNTTRDHLVALTRGAVNAVPFVGGLLGELITSTIPEQRQERIVVYLRELGSRLEQMEQAAMQAALRNPEKIDLIESGGHLSVRATTPNRIAQIAEVVANGLVSNEAEIVRRKRLLALLGEIDDDEVRILADYDKYDPKNMPIPLISSIDDQIKSINLGWNFGYNADSVEREELYKLGIDRLLRIGLLKRKFKIEEWKSPDIDIETGLPQCEIEISYLGRMLLSSIGRQLPFKE
jgi:hypothetical protein